MIDNIFCNDLSYQLDTAIIISDISDHLPIVLCCNIFKTVPKTCSTDDQHKRKLLTHKFSHKISQINWLILSKIAELSLIQIFHILTFFLKILVF